MARIRSRIRSWFVLALLCVLLIPELVVLAKKKKRDHYDVLAVPRDASDRQIKKAFHKLARRFHPDKNKSANAEAKFREIAEAYETLSDDKRRREYDQFGHAAPPTSPGNTGGGWGGGGGGGGGGEGRDYDFQQHFRSFNFDDWFKEFEVFGPQQQQQQDMRTHRNNRVQGANKNKHKQKSQRSSSSSQGGAFGGFFEDFEQMFSLGGGGASGRQQQQQQCRTVTQRRGNMVTTYTVCS